MQSTPPRRQRGISLVEALIAFLVLTLGMLAIVRVQTHLRLNAEIARQRSEAVRLAQADIESLRAFAVLSAAPGAHTFEAIASDSRTVDASGGYLSNTAYQLDRQVVAGGSLQAREIRVAVGWTDRRGDTQQVALVSVIAGIAPAYGGALGLARGVAPTKGVFGRSVRIPLAAKDLGDGRSALNSGAGGSEAFVFDNASGRVVARCTVAATLLSGDLTAATLGSCDAAIGYLVSGVVRFSSALPPDAAKGHDPALALSVVMQMSGGPYASPPSCGAEPVTTPGGDRFVTYHCAVYPKPNGRWSGRTVLKPAGWTIGSGAGDRRVCRYSADLDASGAIDANIEHPAAYTEVDGGLANQHFLVVSGNATCPVGAPVQVTGNNGDVHADLSTAPHQP